MVRYHGAHASSFTSAFLQDADSLILPTEELLEILQYIKDRFPGITRVTSYARAKSLKKKSVESLKLLKEAGLTRIHTGLESGSPEVLKLIRKGETPEDMVEGGRRVVEAGISLSEYIMPGVGGRNLSREHAVETAKVLNQIRPISFGSGLSPFLPDPPWKKWPLKAVLFLLMIWRSFRKSVCSWPIWMTCPVISNAPISVLIFSCM